MTDGDAPFSFNPLMEYVVYSDILVLYYSTELIQWLVSVGLKRSRSKIFLDICLCMTWRLNCIILDICICSSHAWLVYFSVSLHEANQLGYLLWMHTLHTHIHIHILIAWVFLTDCIRRTQTQSVWGITRWSSQRRRARLQEDQTESWRCPREECVD